MPGYEAYEAINNISHLTFVTLYLSRSEAGGFY